MSNVIKLKRGSGSDPSASDLVVGEVALRTDLGKLFTKKDDNSVVEISGEVEDGDITTSKIADDAVTYAKIQNVSATNRILGRDSSGAGAIEEITPANLRTMLNVADGATNVTNTNQLTNGAGFITATLTNEQVQDIVGGMLTGNTETGITVTYQDGDGTIDFVVGTLNQDTTGNAATATALETARTIAGVSFDGSANISLNNNAITNGAGYLTSVATSNINDDAVTYAKIQNVSATNRILGRDSSGAGVIEEITPANLRTMINVEDGATADQSKSDIDALGIAASTAATLATARTIAGVSFDGSANISLNNNAITNGAGYITGSSLNASNLSSGTIPDARFPSTLPAVDGSNLTGISAGATGGGSDEIFYENGQTVTTNYTISNGKNAMSAGPITINSGVTVTVGSGETLTIV